MYSLPYPVHDLAKTAHLVGHHYSEDCMSAEQRLMADCWGKCHRHYVDKSGPDTAGMQCSVITCTSSGPVGSYREPV